MTAKYTHRRRVAGAVPVANGATVLTFHGKQVTLPAADLAVADSATSVVR